MPVGCERYQMTIAGLSALSCGQGAQAARGLLGGVVLYFPRGHWSGSQAFSGD
jgi:hypothetical protein